MTGWTGGGDTSAGALLPGWRPYAADRGSASKKMAWAWVRDPAVVARGYKEGPMAYDCNTPMLRCSFRRRCVDSCSRPRCPPRRVNDCRLVRSARLRSTTCCRCCQLTSCPSSMLLPLLLGAHAASACSVAASCSSLPVPVGSKNSRLPAAAAGRAGRAGRWARSVPQHGGASPGQGGLRRCLAGLVCQPRLDVCLQRV